MEEAARIVERHARRGRIDGDCHRGPGRLVAGKVGRHCSELVASAEAGGIPARLVRGGRVGADRREGAATCRPLLEAHGADARAEIGSESQRHGRSPRRRRHRSPGRSPRPSARCCRRARCAARSCRRSRRGRWQRRGGRTARRRRCSCRSRPRTARSCRLRPASRSLHPRGCARRRPARCRPGTPHVSVTVPARFAPGSSSVGAGGLSTTTVRIAEVTERPALSTTTTLRSALPSAAPVESQLASYGAVVSVEIAGERAGAVRPDEELDRGDARRQRRAAEARDRDRAVDVRAVRGSGQRAARQLRVDANRRRLEGLDVAGVVGRAVLDRVRRRRSSGRPGPESEIDGAALERAAVDAVLRRGDARERVGRGQRDGDRRRRASRRARRRSSSEASCRCAPSPSGASRRCRRRRSCGTRSCARRRSSGRPGPGSRSTCRSGTSRRRRGRRSRRRPSPSR